MFPRKQCYVRGRDGRKSDCCGPGVDKDSSMGASPFKVNCTFSSGQILQRRNLVVSCEMRISLTDGILEQNQELWGTGIVFYKSVKGLCQSAFSGASFPRPLILRFNLHYPAERRQLADRQRHPEMDIAPHDTGNRLQTGTLILKQQTTAPIPPAAAEDSPA